MNVKILHNSIYIIFISYSDNQHTVHTLINSSGTIQTVTQRLINKASALAELTFHTCTALPRHTHNPTELSALPAHS